MIKVDLDKLIEQDHNFHHFMEHFVETYPSFDDMYPMDTLYSLYTIGNTVEQTVRFFKLMDSFHEDCCGDDHTCEHHAEDED